MLCLYPPTIHLVAPPQHTQLFIDGFFTDPLNTRRRFHLPFLGVLWLILHRRRCWTFEEVSWDKLTARVLEGLRSKITLECVNRDIKSNSELAAECNTVNKIMISHNHKTSVGSLRTLFRYKLTLSNEPNRLNLYDCAVFYYSILRYMHNYRIILFLLAVNFFCERNG